MPIRRVPGRPRRGEPPAPQRQRTLRFPVEMDDALVQIATVHGLSPQAAIRLAVAEWIERQTAEGPEQV